MNDTRNEAVLPGTDSCQMSSDGIHQDFDLSVYLPVGYEEKEDRTYPAVYLLEGSGAAFGIVTGISRLLQFGQEVPEYIVIGVSCVTEDVDESLLVRMLNYTPTAVEGQPYSGGAAKFLECMEQEMVPFVESRYRIDSADRSVAGLSFAGLCGIYALYQHPGLFRRCLASSPALWWDNESIFALEEAYASAHDSMPGRLYISVGSEEPPARLKEPVERLAGIMEDREYEGLDVTLDVIEGETHYSAHAAAFAHGLKSIFSG